MVNGSIDQRLTHEAVLDPYLIRLVARFALRHRNIPFLEEDLEQEILLRVLRAIRRTTLIRHPKAFVAKIARDTVQDYWRAHRKLEITELIPEHGPSCLPAFELEIDHAQRCDRLYDCLDRLSKTTREAIELFYLHDYSINDLANFLQLSRSAAKMTLLRGRRKLRQMLQAR